MLFEYPLPSENELVFTVSRLNRIIKTLLEQEVSYLWVVGEVSNLREPSSGHIYFTLKDSQSQIRAVCFRGFRPSNIRFKLVDGLEVICFGRISVYEPRGEYQIIVEKIEPRGIGELKKLFEALKKKLTQEGLFDESRKKALPLCPQRLLIVTSITGAAIRDILKVLSRSPFPLDISIIPVQVQGEKAPADIAEAMKIANELAEFFQWDVIIVGRGGGSLEDLWAFNEEIVVRAIADSKIPVISAVGHEIDVTLADFAADYRAPTPTAAAEWIVDRLEEVRDKLQDFSISLTKIAENLLFKYQQTLDFCKDRLKSPEETIKQRRAQLEELSKTLKRVIDYRLKSSLKDFWVIERKLLLLDPKEKIDSYSKAVEQFRHLLINSILKKIDDLKGKLQNYRTLLEALDPYAVLRRGYAIVQREKDKAIVKTPEDIGKGELVRIKFSKGLIIGRVIYKELE